MRTDKICPKRHTSILADFPRPTIFSLQVKFLRTSRISFGKLGQRQDASFFFGYSSKTGFELQPASNFVDGGIIIFVPYVKET